MVAVIPCFITLRLRMGQRRMNGLSTRSNLRAQSRTGLGTSDYLRVGKIARKLSEPFSTEQAIPGRSRGQALPTLDRPDPGGGSRRGEFRQALSYRKLPPDQPAGADEVDETDREDEDACPLAVAVVSHALDHEWRERCTRDREQDGRRDRPKWNIAHSG